MQGLAEAERLYDGRLPEAYLVADLEEDDMLFVPPAAITPVDVENFIAEYAHTGEMPGSMSLIKSNDPVRYALALQWVTDSTKLAGPVGAAFWQWAKQATFIARGVL